MNIFCNLLGNDPFTITKNVNLYNCNPLYFCMKIVDVFKIASRSCVPKCKQDLSSDIKTYCCNTDQCNTAHKMKIFKRFFFSNLFLVILFNKNF